MVTVCERNCKC